MKLFLQSYHSFDNIINGRIPFKNRTKISKPQKSEPDVYDRHCIPANE